MNSPHDSTAVASFMLFDCFTLIGILNSLLLLHALYLIQADLVLFRVVRIYLKQFNYALFIEWL